MTHILSIDCGTKNLGWSLWCDEQIVGWGRETLVSSSALVSQIREAQCSLVELKEKIGSMLYKYPIDDLQPMSQYSIDVLLVEQQPHINRRACMIHDLVIAAFADVAQCTEIHPSKKNTYQPEMGMGETGKLTKRNTKAIAKRYMTETQWSELGPKKDDVADSIVQFLYWIQNEKKQLDLI